MEYSSDVFQVRVACAHEDCMMHLNKRLCEYIDASILKPSGTVRSHLETFRSRKERTLL